MAEIQFSKYISKTILIKTLPAIQHDRNRETCQDGPFFEKVEGNDWMFGYLLLPVEESRKSDDETNNKHSYDLCSFPLRALSTSPVNGNETTFIQHPHPSYGNPCLPETYRVNGSRINAIVAASKNNPTRSICQKSSIICSLFPKAL